MAGKVPFFITGASAKIKLNNKTLAFCTDLSYSVQVITQTPKVLGMYEGSSVEPLGYSVSGSFTIIRYAKDAQQAIPKNGIAGLTANDAGNGVGNWGGVWGGGTTNILARNGIGTDGRANEALDPSKLAGGTTFDIQVYQKTNNTFGGVVDIGPLLGIANIRNCRITQADFSLSKRGAAVQRFNFTALYVDEDSFVADNSGRGQSFVE
jgi:hypothetical protein